MHKITILIISCMLLMATATSHGETFAGRWQNINYSLSGLARMEPARDGARYSFIGVVDSKNDNEVKTVLINVDNNYRASSSVIEWKNGYPSGLSDLESIAAIPNSKTGAQQQFVATTSSGYFWRFTVNSNKQVDNVLASSDRLKQDGSNSDAKQIESIAFFINANSGNIKLVWAGRGTRDHSAYMFAADLENSSDHIGYNDDNSFQIQETHFNWPRPVWSKDNQSRLISDVKVATNPNGAIYVSSAFDGGDDGPFAGVLYNPGTFTSASNIDFHSAPYPPKTPLFIKDKGKKVEALELLTGSPANGFILGTDDEDLGGYVLLLVPQPY